MEAIFDSKSNYLNANIRSLRNHALLYSISTTKSLFRGRKVTTIRSASGRVVGAIDWRGKTFQVYDKTVPWRSLKSSAGFFSRHVGVSIRCISYAKYTHDSCRRWKWSRYSYKLKHKSHEWTVRFRGHSSCFLFDYNKVNYIG